LWIGSLRLEVYKKTGYEKKPEKNRNRLIKKTGFFPTGY